MMDAAFFLKIQSFFSLVYLPYLGIKVSDDVASGSVAESRKRVNSTSRRGLHSEQFRLPPKRRPIPGPEAARFI